MIPFRFGPPQRQLFGCFHPATGPRQSATSVLLCNPFGQEGVRLHRFYKVLADRLSKSGMHVLRFDYFGTGDSAGDDEQGDLAGWTQDLLRADQELRQRSLCTQTTWVGARLGGSLIAMACAQAQNTSQAPHRVVLWEPITHGQRYLAELARGHTQALANDLLRPKPIIYKTPPGEAMGFGMSPALLSQLSTLEPHVFSALAGTPTSTLFNPGAASNPPIPGVFAPLEHTFDWTSEEAMNTALVPSAALGMLATHIEGLSS